MHGAYDDSVVKVCIARRVSDYAANSPVSAPAAGVTFDDLNPFLGN